MHLVILDNALHKDGEGNYHSSDQFFVCHNMKSQYFPPLHFVQWLWNEITRYIISYLISAYEYIL